MSRLFADNVRGALVLLGIVAMDYGVSLIYRPAAWIVGGALCASVAIYPYVKPKGAR